MAAGFATSTAALSPAGCFFAEKPADIVKHYGHFAGAAVKKLRAGEKSHNGGASQTFADLAPFI